MNINIKKIVIILVLFIKIFLPIFGREIIITVPDQYNTTDLPLPPFPNEVINRLDQNNYEDEIIINQNVRDIPQVKIVYKYYRNFLNQNISNKLSLYNTFGGESDFESVSLYYKPELFNNNFFFQASAQYNLITADYDFYINYREFRLPLDVGIKGELQDRSLLMSLKYTDFLTKLSLEGEFNKDLIGVNLLYSYNSSFMPYVHGAYNNLGDYYGALGLGWDWSILDFRLGPGVINGSVFPYIDLNFKKGLFLINIDTKVSEDNLDYLGELGFNNKNYFKLGGGLTVYKPGDKYEPYISLRENIIAGYRTYRLYKDKFLFDFEIYKKLYTTLFSITIEELNLYTILVENSKYNKYIIRSSMTYNREEKEFTGNIQFEYKVGK